MQFVWLKIQKGLGAGIFDSGFWNCIVVILELKFLAER